MMASRADNTGFQRGSNATVRIHRAGCWTVLLLVVVGVGLVIWAQSSGAQSERQNHALLSATTISRSETLTKNLACSTLTIDPGVTVTTNGFDIVCTNVLTNEGTIATGHVPATTFAKSYGGSGGGAFNLKSKGGSPSSGLATRVAGGRSCTTSGCKPSPGATPAVPPMSTTLVATWVRNGSSGYLSGADGGTSPGLVRGQGGYGVILEGSRIVAGKINSSGRNGQTKSTQATSGGGGGGAIVLSYGSGGYATGSYDVAGGWALAANGAHVGVGGEGSVLLLGPPHVSAEPLNQLVRATTTATFTSTSSGANPTATEQWQISVNGGSSWNAIANGAQGDGSTVTGATSSTLSIANAQSSESGDLYRASFANVVATVDSSSASLSVAFNDGWFGSNGRVRYRRRRHDLHVHPFGRQPDRHRALATLDQRRFVVERSLQRHPKRHVGRRGAPRLSTLTLSNIQPGANDYDYRAAFTNLAGTVDSSTATLTVQFNNGGTAPTSQLVVATTTATFTSTSSGANPTATEQWQISVNGGSSWNAIANGAQGDGSTVTGATSSTLSIANAQSSESGDLYRASFANVVATVDSSSASLSVAFNDGGSAPTGESVIAGAGTTFTSTPSGANPTATELWQLSTNGGSSWSALSNGTQSDTSDVEGATTSTLTLSNIQPGANDYDYRAAFTNLAGTVYSSTATLTVQFNNGGTAPTSQLVVATTTATFTSTSSGANPTATEQWQISVNGGSSWNAIANGAQGDGSTVTGATSSTLSIANAQSSESGDLYRASFANVVATVDSSSASLSVAFNDGGSAPTGESVIAGAGTTFTSTPSGANPTATELWQLSTNGGSSWSALSNGTQSDTSDVEGATTSTLTLSNIQPGANDYDYRAAFTNLAGTVYSSTATLNVTIPATSPNWAGYVDSGTKFKSVSGDWTVSSISCTAGATVFASQWIGIDGYGNSTVEQDGTNAECIDGTVSYNAWYEMYGDNAVNSGEEVILPAANDPVVPGDEMSATVSFAADVWTLAISDTSTAHADWASSTAITFTSAKQASAEWVVERPEVCDPTCGLSTLADFGTASFTNASATTSTGSVGTISATTYSPLDMIDTSSDVLAAPSVLEQSGSAFSVTWESS
jgi:hypothetical protein